MKVLPQNSFDEKLRKAKSLESISGEVLTRHLYENFEELKNTSFRHGQISPERLNGLQTLIYR